MNRQREMLDELLGPDRNKGPTNQIFSGIQFYDDKVCKPYLVCGYCPYELLLHTKRSIGSCNLIHDDALRERWLKNRDNYPYEQDIINLYENLLSNVRRSIQKLKDRLRMHEDQELPISEQSKQHIDHLKSQQDELSEQIDKLNEEGKFKEASEAQEKIDKIQSVIDSIIAKETHGMGKRVIDSEYKKTICDVCGSYLYANNEHKAKSHFIGKQHNGILTIMKTLDELKEKYQYNNNDNEDKGYSKGKHSDSDSYSGDEERKKKSKKEETMNLPERDENGLINEVEYIRKLDPTPRVRKEVLEQWKEESRRKRQLSKRKSSRRSRSPSRSKSRSRSRHRRRRRSRSVSSSRSSSRSRSRSRDRRSRRHKDRKRRRSRSRDRRRSRSRDRRRSRSRDRRRSRERRRSRSIEDSSRSRSRSESRDRKKRSKRERSKSEERSPKKRKELDTEEKE